MKHFEKKDERRNWFVSQITDCKKGGYLNIEKAPCQNTYGQSTCWGVPKTPSIPVAVFSLDFLITLKENQLEKLCFSSIWNLGTVCWDIDTRWQVFSLCKSECLTQPIQMLFSQNQIMFSDIFSPFSEST